MEYLRQIEDDLQALSLEAKRKHPEIKDSTDRAVASLKVIREVYVSDMMKKTQTKDKNKNHLPQSSDVIAPYILTCNYADANPKIISMSLNGIQMLLNYDMIPPSEVKNILRVLSIQANTGRSENQLKLLQIILQLANFLAQDDSYSPYLTESTVCILLTIAIQLCDIRNSVSVSSTAFVTSRQIIALLMNSVISSFRHLDTSSNIDTDNVIDNNSSKISTSQTKTASAKLRDHQNLTLCTSMLIKDIILFINGQSGEWIKGTYLGITNSLDLINDILTDWPSLFQLPHFSHLIRDLILPTFRPLFKCLQDDYCSMVARSGQASAASITTRITRVARCLLLSYINEPPYLDDFDLCVTFLVHSLQPDRGGSSANHADRFLAPSYSATRSNANDQYGYSLSSNSLSSVNASVGINNFINKLNFGKAINTIQSSVSKAVEEGIGGGGGSTVGVTVNSSHNANMSSVNNLNSLSIPSNMLLQLHQLNSNNHPELDIEKGSTIPAYPAGSCIEVLMSLFLSDVPNNLLHNQNSFKSLNRLITSVVISLSSLLKSSLIIKSNAELLASQYSTSPFTVLTDKVLNGNSDTNIDYEVILRSLHDSISSCVIDSADVLVLSYVLLRLIVRFILKLSFMANFNNSLTSGKIQHQQSVNNGNSSLKSKLFIDTCLYETIGSSTSKTSTSTIVQTNHNTQNELSQTTPIKVSSPVTNTSQTTLTVMSNYLHTEVASLLENIITELTEVLVLIFNTIDSRSVYQHAVSMLCELAVVSGTLNHKSCESIILSILNLAFNRNISLGSDNDPLMDYELIPHPQQSSDNSNSNLNNNNNTTSTVPPKTLLKQRHLFGIQRSMQIINIAANVINDWDNIVSSFELYEDGDSSDKLPDISKKIKQFNQFTVFLSNETLVKLMTSLVVMSLNICSNLETNTHKKYDTNNIHIINYSLLCVVAITKYNSFRMSVVFSMVASHLRMLSSLKSPKLRMFAVQSLFEIINASFEYTYDSHKNEQPIWMMSKSTSSSRRMSIQDTTNNNNNTNANANNNNNNNSFKAITINSHNRFLTDDVVFSHIFPTFDNCFDDNSIPKSVVTQLQLQLQHGGYNDINNTNNTSFSAHSSIPNVTGTAATTGASTTAVNETVLHSNNPHNPVLSQEDLLVAVKSLATSTKYDDVRERIITSILEIITLRGHLLRIGWTTLVDIMTNVPMSMTTVAASSTAVSASAVVTALLSVKPETTTLTPSPPPSNSNSNSNINSISASTKNSNNDGNNNVKNATTTNTTTSTSIGTDLDKIESNNTNNCNNSTVSSTPPSLSVSITGGTAWPKKTLYSSFSCVKFLVDDYLEFMTSTHVKDLIICLTAYVQQSIDINVSVTSIENIWIVMDKIFMKHKNTTSTSTSMSSSEEMFDILKETAKQFLQLGMNSKPEIRNCAINSLFSLVNRNALLFSDPQWLFLFSNTIFPLFDLMHNRLADSTNNIANNEVLTLELKKGVKMNIHHSRDTLQKQWSETRTIALKGLNTLVQTSYKYFRTNSWYKEHVWSKALIVCKLAIQSVYIDKEVSQTGLFVLFNMLKLSKPMNNATTSNTNTNTNKTLIANSTTTNNTTNNNKDYDDGLFRIAWLSVKEAACFSSPSAELGLQMCQSLTNLYNESTIDFLEPENLKFFLEALLLMSRPRMDVSNHSLSTTYYNKHSMLSIQQMHRILITTLKSICFNNKKSVFYYISTLCEIAFSTQIFEIISMLPGQSSNESVFLGPYSEKLRTDITEYLIDLFRNRICVSSINAILDSNEIPDSVSTSNKQSLQLSENHYQHPQQLFHYTILSTGNEPSKITEVVIDRFIYDNFITSFSLRKVFSHVYEQSISTLSTNNVASTTTDMNITSTSNNISNGNPSIHQSSSLLDIFYSNIHEINSNNHIDLHKLTHSLLPEQKNQLTYINDLSQLSSLDMNWTGYINITLHGLDVLLDLFKFMLETNTKLEDTCWMKIVTTTACILSPWKVYEVGDIPISTPDTVTVTPSSSTNLGTNASNNISNEELNFQKLISFLDMIFDLRFQHMLYNPISFGYLIDSICATSRLIVRNIIANLVSTSLSSSTDIEASPTTTSTSSIEINANSTNNTPNSVAIPTNTNNARILRMSITNQLALLAMIRKKVVNIINSNNRNVLIRHRALEGYLQITCDVANFFLDGPQQNNNIYHNIEKSFLDDFLYECQMFFENLIEIHVDFIFMPTELSNSLIQSITQQNEISLLNDWINVHTIDTFEEILSKSTFTPFNSTSPLRTTPSNDSLNNSIDKQQTSTSNIQNLKIHLLLLLPVVVRLAASNWATLQKTSHDILSHFDITEFVSNYHNLTNRLEESENENIKLRIELAALKN